MIYAVEILDRRFVKIGFTDSDAVETRIAALQTGCPFQIKPMFCTPGSLRQEQSLHSALSAAFGRIRVPIPPNEWYPGKNPFFVEFLSWLESSFDAGLSFAEKYNAAVRQPSVKDGRGDVSTNAKWPSGKGEFPTHWN